MALLALTAAAILRALPAATDPSLVECRPALHAVGPAACLRVLPATAVSAGTDPTRVLAGAGNVDCYGDTFYGRSRSHAGGLAVAVSAAREPTCCAVRSEWLADNLAG